MSHADVSSIIAFSGLTILVVMSVGLGWWATGSPSTLLVKAWLDKEMTRARIRRGFFNHRWTEVTRNYACRNCFNNHVTWAFDTTGYRTSCQVAHQIERARQRVLDRRERAQRAGKEWLNGDEIPKARVVKKDAP